MSEYIHSGIAGKINRIVKPHIGNVLVTSEFGNAKESTLTEDVLKTAVNDINRIKYAVTYKGEKATVDALPTTNNTKGDMWNVAENGHNYAWTGSEWDDLGGNSSSSTLSNFEPYQLVFTLEVTGSPTQEQMIITNEDLGGQYKDILIYCLTPSAPLLNMGGDPTPLMHLAFIYESTSLIDFDNFLLNTESSYPFFFIYQFLNDGGIIKGKQGKTKLTSLSAIPVFNNTLAEVIPFPPGGNVDETVAPEGIFIGPSLPINSALAVYARNKLNSNEQSTNLG